MLKQGGDQAEREKEGKMWRDFLRAVWEAIHGQLTEAVRNMGIFMGQDVRGRLNGMCEMLRVDIGGAISKFPGGTTRIRAMFKGCC